MSSQSFCLESTLGELSESANTLNSTEPLTVSDVPLKLRLLTEEILQEQKFTDFARLEQVTALENLAEKIAVLLRSLHNHLLPVQRLPVDVLRTVFDQTDGPGNVSGKGNPNALPLSHVCRRWRDIAIGHATLWNCFTLSNSSIELNQIHLERSRSAPLTVAIDIPDVYDDGLAELEKMTMENFKLVASHNQKIVSLRISAPSSINHLLRFLDFSTPQLRQLHLKAAQSDNDARRMLLRFRRRAPGFEKALLLPDPLFQGCYPALRSIGFTDVSQSALERFGNLTSILLCSEMNTAWGFSTLLDLLRRCPLLQSLEIRRHRFHLEANGGGIVHLPALTRVHLTGTPSHHILSNINAPNISDFLICVPFDTSHFGSFSLAKRIQYLRITELAPANTVKIFGYNSAKSLCFTVDDYKDLPVYVSHLSQASLENCTDLEIKRKSRGPELPTYINQLYSSAYALKTLYITDPFYPALYLQPLIDHATICPDLDAVVVSVDQEYLNNTFHGVRALVAARAKVGKVISVGHTAVDGDDGISMIWNRFCDEYRIQRFEGSLCCVETRLYLNNGVW